MHCLSLGWLYGKDLTHTQVFRTRQVACFAGCCCSFLVLFFFCELWIGHFFLDTTQPRVFCLLLLLVVSLFFFCELWIVKRSFYFRISKHTTSRVLLALVAGLFRCFCEQWFGHWFLAYNSRVLVALLRNCFAVLLFIVLWICGLAIFLFWYNSRVLLALDV